MSISISKDFIPLNKLDNQDSFDRLISSRAIPGDSPSEIEMVMQCEGLAEGAAKLLEEAVSRGATKQALEQYIAQGQGVLAGCDSFITNPALKERLQKAINDAEAKKDSAPSQWQEPEWMRQGRVALGQTLSDMSDASGALLRPAAAGIFEGLRNWLLNFN